jgi:F-box and WD-40 domain protein 1/11
LETGKGTWNPHDIWGSEELVPFPALTTKHRPSKSFSSLRHGVSELRAAARRLSVTLRHKSSKHTLDLPWGGTGAATTPTEMHQTDSKGGWFRSHRLPHRTSLGSLHALNHFYRPSSYVGAPIPGSGSGPPILPEDRSRGAAARAAAAAQNETVRVRRVGSKRDSRRWDSKVFDLKLFRDSESGIEIDLRDRVDGSEEEPDVIRKGSLPISRLRG